MSGKFDRDHIISAIKQWLEYGEQSLNLDQPKVGHKGYFSRGGWAYEALTAHLKELEQTKSVTVAGTTMHLPADPNAPIIVNVDGESRVNGLHVSSIELLEILRAAQDERLRRRNLAQQSLPLPG